MLKEGTIVWKGRPAIYFPPPFSFHDVFFSLRERAAIFSFKGSFPLPASPFLTRPCALFRQ